MIPTADIRSIVVRYPLIRSSVSAMPRVGIRSPIVVRYPPRFSPVIHRVIPRVIHRLSGRGARLRGALRLALAIVAGLVGLQLRPVDRAKRGERRAFREQHTPLAEPSQGQGDGGDRVAGVGGDDRHRHRARARHVRPVARRVRDRDQHLLVGGAGTRGVDGVERRSQARWFSRCASLIIRNASSERSDEVSRQAAQFGQASRIVAAHTLAELGEQEVIDARLLGFGRSLSTMAGHGRTDCMFTFAPSFRAEPALRGA